jgi:hypothetical protein
MPSVARKAEKKEQHAYNLLMLRAAPLALLVASLLTATVQAQRSSATFQGHAASLPMHSGFRGQRGLSNGFFPQRDLPNSASPNRCHRPNAGILFPYFVPNYDPFWYEQSDTAEASSEPAPPVVIEQRDDVRMPENPPPKSKIIDIPGGANSKVVKTLPPTIFILTNGERLESRTFLLTASDLSLNVNRYYRTIPLQMLNLDATITANRERGIDLRVPTDRNEISLSF